VAHPIDSDDIRLGASTDGTTRACSACLGKMTAEPDQPPGRLFHRGSEDLVPYAGRHIHQILKAVTASDYPDPSADSDWRRDFVEDMGGLVLTYGAPRALMRVLGWMVVCECPDQAAADVQKELRLSAGSVSTSLRYLSEMGLVERVSRPGDRRIFYRLNTDGWEILLQKRFRAFNEIRVVADKAVRSAAGQANDRLHEMRDTWAFLEAGSAELLAGSRARRDRASATQGETAPRPND
jgi:DNA-binding transcriptional regulator GbsR (MarR family)